MLNEYKESRRQSSQKLENHRFDRNLETWSQFQRVEDMPVSYLSIRAVTRLMILQGLKRVGTCKLVWCAADH